uniref:Uncharacterized protein n=1 Tax=Cucumis sativus TaxID=3659 RepID=A0A0A0LI66_CUCSA
MELSLVANGYHRHVLRTRLPTPSSVMASASHAVTTIKNNQSNSVAILPKEPQFLPGSSNAKLINGAQKRHSKSYLERQSAIAQVKDCSELAPALARFFFSYLFATCSWILNCGKSFAQGHQSPCGAPSAILLTLNFLGLNIALVLVTLSLFGKIDGMIVHGLMILRLGTCTLDVILLIMKFSNGYLCLLADFV